LGGYMCRCPPTLGDWGIRSAIAETANLGFMSGAET
jgi:hypothetical protein